MNAGSRIEKLEKVLGGAFGGRRTEGNEDAEILAAFPTMFKALEGFPVAWAELLGCLRHVDLTDRESVSSAVLPTLDQHPDARSAVVAAMHDAHEREVLAKMTPDQREVFAWLKMKETALRVFDEEDRRLYREGIMSSPQTYEARKAKAEEIDARAPASVKALSAVCMGPYLGQLSTIGMVYAIENGKDPLAKWSGKE